MIEVVNLSYGYDRDRRVLRQVGLSIKEGEYVVIVGPNGCGKTTLLRHLNGLLLPLEGEILVDGMNTKDPAALGPIRERVGMVFGNPDDQLFGMTVEEDVSFGPGNLNLPPDEIRKRVESAMDAVGVSGYSKSAPHLLSDGEKQLVAVAGVLAMHPKYIAFDEPTAYLDPSSRQRVLEVMLRLNRQGITILHVTHQMDDLSQADRAVVMEGGRILFDEPPASLLSRPDTLKSVGLSLPVLSELMWRLREKGLDVSPSVLTVDAACREIMEWRH